MSIYVNAPISTEVIESNPDCKISGEYENGSLVITIDTQEQNHHQRLGIGTKTKLHWGKENTYEVQELSTLLCPITYRVIVREGYYLDEEGNRVHFTTQATGLDPRRKVSNVLMRASVLLLVIAGIGYRRASWLLSILFHVDVSKSSLQRWVGEVAANLPSGDEIIRLLNERKPITEGHFDELFPKGLDSCILVIKDEHGRIIATQEVDKRDEDSVKPFLQRLKDLGLSFHAFYIDGCKAYFNAIRAVFGKSVAIQYDYFHIIQNAWRHLWKWAVAHRRDLKERSGEVKTSWYKKNLEELAAILWKNRYLLFTSEKNMDDEDKDRLQNIIDSDKKVGTLRNFLRGIWNIFEGSKDAKDAREALDDLKQAKVDPCNPEPFQKVINFLEENFRPVRLDQI